MAPASSAKEDEVDHYLDLLDARELADAWTTSADVEATKPAPTWSPRHSIVPEARATTR